MKKIGFLSFGHWTQSPQSGTRSAADALLQSIDLAVAAEELGADGAYFRVHHFARQLASPFPLLAAVGAQDEAHRDRHGGRRHALREPALHGRGRGRGGPDRRRPAAARHQPRLAGAGDRRLAPFRLPPRRRAERRRHGPAPRRGVSRTPQGRGFAQPNPRPMFPNPPGLLRLEPYSKGLARTDLVGRGLQRDRRLGGEARHEPAELDAQGRRDRRAVPHPAGRADPRLPRRLGGDGAQARSRAYRSAAASSRWSTIATAPISARPRGARTRSASSTRRRAPSSAAATPPSRTR